MRAILLPHDRQAGVDIDLRALATFRCRMPAESPHRQQAGSYKRVSSPRRLWWSKNARSPLTGYNQPFVGARLRAILLPHDR